MCHICNQQVNERGLFCQDHQDKYEELKAAQDNNEKISKKDDSLLFHMIILELDMLDREIARIVVLDAQKQLEKAMGIS